MPDQKEKYVQLDEVIARHRGEPGALMPVLQEAQNIFGYVPLDVQEKIADGLGTTLSEVYGVSTFYSQFALEPRGKYIIGVCLGTACYVKGSKEVLQAVSDTLEIPVGKTTKDGLFTIKDTRCLGACGLAPVMMINDDVYGRLAPGDIPGIMQKYRDAEANA